MRKTQMFIAAASLAFSGFVFAPIGAARAEAPGGLQQNGPVGDKNHTSPADQAAASAAKPDNAGKLAPADKLAPGSNLPAADVRGIQALLASAVDHALTPGDAASLVHLFCKADQERFAKDTALKNDVLDAQLTAFQNNWKEKYSEAFKIEGKEEQLFNALRIEGGSWDENAQTAAARIGPSNEANTPAIPSGAGTNQGTTGTGVSNRAATVVENGAQVAAAGNVARDSAAAAGANQGSAQTAAQPLAANAKPQDHATVFIPSMRQQPGSDPAASPEVGLNVVREEGSWRIALSSGTSAEQVRERLVRHVTEINEMKGKWADDASVAKQLVAARVLRSFARAETVKSTGNDVRNGINDTSPVTPPPVRKQ